MAIGEKLVSKAEFESWAKQLEKRLASLEIKEIEAKAGITMTIDVIADLDLDSNGHVLSIAYYRITIKEGLITKVELV